MATATGGSMAVDVAGRVFSAASTAGHEAGREEGRDGAAASVATSVPVPVNGAAVPAAGRMKLADHSHQQDAPVAAGAIERKHGKKRRRAGGVAYLRAFNRQGLAEDGPSDERRSVKRVPSAVEEGATRGRVSKRARQPKVPWTG